MKIQSNIKRARDIEAKVREHPLCAQYVDIGTHYRVVYPDGCFPKWIQAYKRLGKVEALTRLLAAMERHWAEGVAS